MATPEVDRESVERLLVRCQKTEFYGRIQIIMQKGKIVQEELVQTLKPEDVVSGKEPEIVKRVGSG